MTDGPSLATTARTETAAERSTRDQSETTSSSPAGESGAPIGSETVAPWIDEDRCDLPPDVLFDVLKNQRRRLVLQYLREAEASVRIGTLAEHIAAFENDVPPRGLNAQQRKRVYIGLYQCHLPKMADVDVIDFNQARGIIELGTHGEELFEFLDADVEPGDSPRPFFGLALGGVAGLLLSRLFLPGWSWDLVVGGTLVAVTLLLIHGYRKLSPS